MDERDELMLEPRTDESPVEAAVVATARALLALLALGAVAPVTSTATVETLLALAERLDELV